MTGYKMRRIQVRLEKLGKLFPAKPVIAQKQAISHAAVQQMSGEDLMVLRRMIIAGRQLQASSEREAQAVAAYRSAVEKVIRLRRVVRSGNPPLDGSSKPLNKSRHFEVNVMTCQKDRGFVLSNKIHLSSRRTE